MSAAGYRPGRSARDGLARQSREVRRSLRSCDVLLLRGMWGRQSANGASTPMGLAGCWVDLWSMSENRGSSGVGARSLRDRPRDRAIATRRRLSRVAVTRSGVRVSRSDVPWRRLWRTASSAADITKTSWRYRALWTRLSFEGATRCARIRRMKSSLSDPPLLTRDAAVRSQLC